MSPVADYFVLDLLFVSVATDTHARTINSKLRIIKMTQVGTTGTLHD